MRQTRELIELVEHSAEGTGTYQVVATFRTYRKRRDGNHQLVYVELLDSGTPGDYRSAGQRPRVKRATEPPETADLRHRWHLRQPIGPLWTAMTEGKTRRRVAPSDRSGGCMTVMSALQPWAALSSGDDKIARQVALGRGITDEPSSTSSRMGRSTLTPPSGPTCGPIPYSVAETSKSNTRLSHRSSFRVILRGDRRLVGPLTPEKPPARRASGEVATRAPLAVQPNRQA